MHTTYPSTEKIPERAIRRRLWFPSLAAGQAGGSLPLRRPPRRRESGGTPVLRLRLVGCRLGVCAWLTASKTVAMASASWACVLPLLSPFRSRCRGGSEGSSDALLLLYFSGRPWRRGEKVVVVLGVFSFDVSTPTGHGGEGSGV